MGAASLAVALAFILTGCGGSSSNTPVTPPNVTLTSVAVTPSAPTLAVGSSKQLTATANYSDSSTKDVTATATWSSSNSNVAYV